jgi:hypothetical protein
MPVVKKKIETECEAEGEQVLHTIADRWHGDLKAYLLSIARDKDAAVRKAHEREEDRATDSMLRFARR